MRLISLITLLLLLLLLMTTSCTGLRGAKLLKAGYQPEDEEESWASKYIPGVRSLSNLIPPPTDARREWDERQRRANQPGWSSDRYPDL